VAGPTAHVGDVAASPEPFDQTGDQRQGDVDQTSVGRCVIQADEPGNADYNAAPEISQSFNVAKAAGQITLGTVPLPYGVVGTSREIPATGLSTEPVTLRVDAFVNQRVAHGVGADGCLREERGDADYTAAPEVQVRTPVLLTKPTAA
jgi:hypothetical protein